MRKNSKVVNGETGYPFVDAGMRELNKTGFMHNDAYDYGCFLVNIYSLIGAGVFYLLKPLDYELASNNNWQWSAGTG